MRTILFQLGPAPGILPFEVPSKGKTLATPVRRQSTDELPLGDGLVHTRRPNTSNNQTSWFIRALETAGLDRMTVHDLRRTAASLGISSGANVKAVQRMLGHASAAMTLDTYADLFEDDLDSVSDALDKAAAISNVGKMWANGEQTAR